MSILQKRSLVAGTLPTTASLLVGEIGINVPDGRIFLRKSGSTDTIQSAITTGAQNSGSVTLSGSLALYGTSGSVLSVASDTLEFNGDQMELTGSFVVSGSMKVTGSLSVLNGPIDFNGDQMEFTGSFINSGSLKVIGTSSLTGSVLISGSLNVFNDEFIVQSTGVTIGNIITDTHNITGSLNVSGSVNVLSNEFVVQPTGVKVGNVITDAHTITGSFSVSGSINIDGGTY
jgi:hypothetical protein